MPVNVVGISAFTIALIVGIAALPVVGPARNVFAVCVMKAGARVPVVVIGDPLTVELNNTPGIVMATDVTPPPPPPDPGPTFVQQFVPS
jgi:hypothetical protein